MSSTELLYLAPGDVLKGRVEPIGWMQTCRAFAEQGLSVRLATLRVRRPDGIHRDQVWRHFGVSPCFRVVLLRTPLGSASSGRWFQLWAGAAGLLLATRELARRALSGQPLIVYSRSPLLLAPWAVLRRLVPRQGRPLLVLELHAMPASSTSWVARRADLLVVNSEKLGAAFVNVFRVPPERVLVAPLGPFVDVESLSVDEARGQLGLAAEDRIACYTGKFTREQNDWLLQVARLVADRLPRFRLLLVGGNPEILAWTAARVAELGLVDTVELTGFIEPARVSVYQSAADVLVYHMSSTIGHYAYATPAKALEYQAVGRPIVATSFPLFHEVFGEDGERAFRVADDDPAAFADATIRAFGLDDGGRAMAERGRAAVRNLTWERRVALVLERIRAVEATQRES